MSEANNTGRGTLLLIAGIPLAIILASTVLWFSVSRGGFDLVGALGTANKGRLLEPPVALAQLEPLDAQGQPYSASGAEPIWRILVRGAADCDEQCRHLLYYTRQIHTAMGKYSPRIERAYLAAGAAPGDAGPAALLDDYPELKLLYTSAPATQALPGGDGAPAAYFVMDPEGWIILAYTADADGKDIMADLKFLLKNSGG